MSMDAPMRMEQICTRETLEKKCSEALKKPGDHIIFVRTRVFSTQQIIEYDPIDVSIVTAKLQNRGLLVDYGVSMDSKTCSNYIIIRQNPTVLTVTAEVKK
jgi:hypothetical protein